MKIKAFFAALLILAACGSFAAAAPAIVVEGVQMPAWVEHAGGARDPLIICLIEGRITVIRDKDAFIMDQPMSF